MLPDVGKRGPAPYYAIPDPVEGLNVGSLYIAVNERYYSATVVVKPSPVGLLAKI
jgi:hypothetical protein